MTSVLQLLEPKSKQLITISPERSTYEALQLMAQHDIGAILVMEQDRFVGLLTEREYARRIVLHGKTSRHTPVRDTMNRDLLTVPPEASIEECMSLMTEKRIRYLPVLEKDHLIGLISIGDVVKHIIQEQSAHLDHLQRYITGV